MCKALLHVKTSTCNMAVYGELGRYPLYINIYLRIVKFWSKIVNSDNIIITYLYNSLCHSCNRGVNNWAMNVKRLLDRYGYSFIWNNPENVEWKNFHMQFKQRVIDEFTQSWNATLINSGSLCTYSLFKCSIGYETYLDKLSCKLKTAVTRLRMSSHELRIETGRYGNNRIERNQRHCTLCNLLDLEDEYHFILICPRYHDLRQLYIKQYYRVRPSMFKFIQLMQCQQYSVMHRLGKFIYHASLIRQAAVTITVL